MKDSQRAWDLAMVLIATVKSLSIPPIRADR